MEFPGSGSVEHILGASIMCQMVFPTLEAEHWKRHSPCLLLIWGGRQTYGRVIRHTVVYAVCVKPEIDRYSLCGEDLENFLLDMMPEPRLEGLVIKSWEVDERTRIGRD